MSDARKTSETTATKVEMLEVEDEDTRQHRLESIMQKMNATSASATGNTISSLHFQFEERKTFAVQPPSELLSRVQAFLPQLEASNALLSQRMQSNPQSVDIEHIDPGAEQYIQMNLGLGLFEQRAKSAGQESADYEMGESPSSSLSGSSGRYSDDSESSEDESDEDEIITCFVPAAISRPIKPLPRRGRPHIVVLNDQQAESTEK